MKLELIRADYVQICLALEDRIEKCEYMIRDIEKNNYKDEISDSGVEFWQKEIKECKSALAKVRGF